MLFHLNIGKKTLVLRKEWEYKHVKHIIYGKTIHKMNVEVKTLIFVSHPNRICLQSSGLWTEIVNKPQVQGQAA